MRFALMIAAAGTAVLAACSSSHVDNPTISLPPAVSFTGTAGASSQGSSSQGARGLADPCSLLTAAQVKAAFTGTASAGVVPPAATRPECQWTVSGSNVGATGTVTVSYPPEQSSAAFEAAKAALPGATKVPELGDDAYYAATTLTVLVGEHQFVVQGDFGDAADAGNLQADLIAVAQLVETHV